MPPSTHSSRDPDAASDPGERCNPDPDTGNPTLTNNLDIVTLIQIITAQLDRTFKECFQQLAITLTPPTTTMESKAQQCCMKYLIESRWDLAWESVIIETLPLCLRETALHWYEVLGSHQCAELKTGWTIWEMSLCNVFQPDASEIQCLAGECKWEWMKESIASYFYTKLSLLCAALPTCQETDLLNKIWYGLPASLQLDVQTHLLVKPNMDDLLTELCNLKGPWKATLHSGSCYNFCNDLLPQPLTPSLMFSTPTIPTSNMTTSSHDEASVPHLDSWASTKFGLATNYSLANISYIAKDGQSGHTYQLLNSKQVITLGCPCRLCFQDHFDFEHDYLSCQPKTKAHITQAGLDLAQAYGYSATDVESVCALDDYISTSNILEAMTTSQNGATNTSIHESEVKGFHALPLQGVDGTGTSRN
ncbi:hypothetical protein NDA11_005341 [Ustilago hordei]|nr:hypothetical protein NDA10_005744 [Ustilago hordei]KAJ1570896.1 hypothetical protein NDA11_005341 [Ustilago hordei]UTT96581.1 hypothetical protein NDA17_005352 [Ustilago hordei]